jgi:hypothetical protein
VRAPVNVGKLVGEGDAKGDAVRNVAAVGGGAVGRHQGFDVRLGPRFRRDPDVGLSGDLGLAGDGDCGRGLRLSVADGDDERRRRGARGLQAPGVDAQRVDRGVAARRRPDRDRAAAVDRRVGEDEGAGGPLDAGLPRESLPSSPWTVKDPLKAGSTLLIETVSSPRSPLMVNEVAESRTVTLSKVPLALRIVIIPGVGLLSRTIWSARRVPVKTRLGVTDVSVIGSRPA